MKIRQVILIKMYENNHNAVQRDISVFRGGKNHGVQTERSLRKGGVSGTEADEFWVGMVVHSASR